MHWKTGDTSERVNAEETHSDAKLGTAQGQSRLNAQRTWSSGWTKEKVEALLKLFQKIKCVSPDQEKEL